MDCPRPIRVEKTEPEDATALFIALDSQGGAGQTDGERGQTTELTSGYSEEAQHSAGFK